MKIAFIDTSGLTYTPETPFLQPLGGTQSAACFLSSALAAQGHKVSLLSPGAPEALVMGVRCAGFDFGTAAAELNDHDAVIVLTTPIAARLRQAGVTAPLLNWQHKAVGSNGAAPFAEPDERAAWTSTIFVSAYQRDTFASKWGMTGEVIGNAINPTLARTLRTAPSFVERGEDPVLFYASAPGRGLDFLLMSFPTIRKALPNVRLKIFSDQAMYQIRPENDEFSVYYEVARSLPGIDYVGGISQSRLAEEMLSADIWAYPTTFIETSCIVMMEGAAAGCMLVGSDIGALRETSGRFGRLAPLTNSRSGWSGAFARNIVQEVQRARQDPAAYGQFIDDQMAWFRTQCDWNRRAEQWSALIQELAPVSANQRP
ncbi:glycosyltransferase family 4 protein [Caulobacter henricii]|uniref:Glycosyltransferase n=1 Tax=Caulobacter henricii TaxID=69395 RepID=A0A0P0NZI1_9CAUL|nr:glycosyltransferase family 4 protein [Caulobacter henricii]ALL13540.1 hypothetical protein AQ619_09350 [Caulobacter henricii]